MSINTIKVRLASVRNMFGLDANVYSAYEKAAEEAGLVGYKASRFGTEFVVEAEGHYFPIDCLGIMTFILFDRLEIVNPEQARTLLYTYLGADCGYARFRAYADCVSEWIEKHYKVKPDEGWKEICRMYNVAV